MPPNTYTCHICGLKGHWKKNCPQKDMERIKRLNEQDLRQVARESNMSQLNANQWIKYCQEQQRQEFMDIDDGMNVYYAELGCIDYRDSTANGKFVRHVPYGGNYGW